MSQDSHCFLIPFSCFLHSMRSSLISSNISSSLIGKHGPIAARLYFERWTATHTGDLKLPKLPAAPATGRQSTSPAFPFSVVWDPDGRVIFEHLGPAVDRFEGNTKGKVAVFGLLDTAGLPLDVSVGNPILVFAQKVNAFLDFDGTSAKAYSKPEDVPSWWKSEAVGGEVNDV